MTKHSISIPSSKKEEENFNKLMTTYFESNYLKICTTLIRLSKEVLDAIFLIQCGNTSIEHVHLTSNFWTIFANAAKKN